MTSSPTVIDEQPRQQRRVGRGEPAPQAGGRAMRPVMCVIAWSGGTTRPGLAPGRAIATAQFVALT